MKIFLTRHGTTEWNADHRVQGITDIELDDLGRKMARETYSALFSRGIEFDIAFSSPLKRAMETASILAPGLDLKVDDRLRELSFGPMEGGKVEEMSSDESSPFRFFKNAPDRYNELVKNVEGAESLEHLCRRSADFMSLVIEPMLETDPDADILISTHGAQSRGIMMYVRNEKEMYRFWQGGLLSNCGMVIIELTAEKGYEILEENAVFYSEELSKKVSALL